ncbi:MAG: hypothetical protein AUK47_01625 [Deltaproteobacteria bacterium CG2_30_63_29]|nr:MAG: hypothetical protein AUK47_01625 [Deltaproteobacteria bacterium CG2_30_63_29]PJB43513.1 MAG: hypothetical protein CO108_09855 [Deltaproteobacteria bacterium CG_4_9_14_3_um_filter_63_12]
MQCEVTPVVEAIDRAIVANFPALHRLGGEEHCSRLELTFRRRSDGPRGANFVQQLRAWSGKPQEAGLAL